MDKEVLLAIFGVIGGLAGTIRWLLGYYFKKQEESDDNRHDYVTGEIFELKSITQDHAKKMSDQAKDLKELEKKLDLAIARYSQYQDGHESVLESLKSFVDANNQRILSLEGRVVELGRDLYMIKSKDSKN